MGNDIIMANWAILFPSPFRVLPMFYRANHLVYLPLHQVTASLTFLIKIWLRHIEHFNIISASQHRANWCDTDLVFGINFDREYKNT